MGFTSPEFLLGVAGSLSLGAIVVAILTLRPTRRKLTAEARKANEEAQKADADSTAVITSTAISLLGPMKTEITELRAEVDSLSTKLVNANSELDEARAIIRDLKYQASEMRRELDRYRQVARESFGHTLEIENESEKEV